MADGRTFRLNVGKWADLTQDKLDALVRQTCQELAERVVRDTPVDTGFLRASWQPSIGRPSEQAPGAGSPGTVSLVASQVKAGEVFYMTNNASYGRYVEFGTSKMAGRYFVTDNVKRFRSVAEKYARQLKGGK